MSRVYECCPRHCAPTAPRRPRRASFPLRVRAREPYDDYTHVTSLDWYTAGFLRSCGGLTAAPGPKYGLSSYSSLERLFGRRDRLNSPMCHLCATHIVVTRGAARVSQRVLHARVDDGGEKEGRRTQGVQGGPRDRTPRGFPPMSLDTSCTHRARHGSITSTTPRTSPEVARWCAGA